SSWVEKTDVFAFNENDDKRESVEMAILAIRTLPEGSSSTVETEGSVTGESRTVNPETGETETVEKSREESPDSSADTKKDESDSNENEAKVSQVLVVSDSSFIRNANIGKYFNRDFAMNSVNWLTNRQDFIAIRPTERKIRSLDLSSVQKSLIFAFSVVLTPLMIAGLGCLVWWKRR
ncbi:MAG: hypothetical protein ABIC40_05855, partial [bacterium]